MRAWDNTAAADDILQDEWLLRDFDNDQYHLGVYGPNGFYREFTGDRHNPAVTQNCSYEHSHLNKLTGNLVVHVTNHDGKEHTASLADNSYGNPVQSKSWPRAAAHCLCSSWSILSTGMMLP